MAKRNLKSNSAGLKGKTKSFKKDGAKFKGRRQNHNNPPKSLNEKLKLKKMKKMENKKKNLRKEEEEIAYIENENELFYGDRYIGTEEVNEDDWNINSNTNEVNLSEMLFNKMNNVEEKKLDPRIVETYTILGEILTKYTSGKLPKAFNILPVTENWEEIIELTNPSTWSPQAMFEATKMFSSNLNAALAEKFNSKILLPNVRADIKRSSKLNIHLYNCLKKAIFKPSGFFKGVIIPLSDSTTAKEASVIGSIIRKCSIPVSHSSACIMKLIDKCFQAHNNLSMGALFFTKMLLLKKYALPTQVKEALVNFFYKFLDHPVSERLPVLWHQTLLVFSQIYKLDLTEEEKNKLKVLVNKHNHHLITDDILRELNYKPAQVVSLLNKNRDNMMTD